MFSCGISRIIATVFIVGCSIFVEINAKHGGHKTRDDSVVCYECNSLYDPRCGDPFDSYTIGSVNCSLKRRLDHIDSNARPSICRKTVQKVQGHTRIVRGCGYIPDVRDDKECVRRSGTHEVTVHYCSCTKSLCNKGHQYSRPSLRIIILAIIPAITTLLALS